MTWTLRASPSWTSIISSDGGVGKITGEWHSVRNATPLQRIFRVTEFHVEFRYSKNALQPL